MDEIVKEFLVEGYESLDRLDRDKLEAVAHVGENLLSKLRDGVITLNPELASALLATVDAIPYMLGQIEITDHPGDKDFTLLINLLTRLNEGCRRWPGRPWTASTRAGMSISC